MKFPWHLIKIIPVAALFFLAGCAGRSGEIGASSASMSIGACLFVAGSSHAETDPGGIH
ncbi:hypothetical protein [Nitrosovibrio sp. Nv17]|jgi:hypothetical protein|uniref:hypothetical protein n=1 Tax=Nitrosovibrio sp. Nv17 TaxID=1855339 RepID=UPI000A8A5B80|nr:hypothetical protein [Nitrosovibrio sp. Nv17]